MSITIKIFLGIFALLSMLFPDLAFASGGISEFEGPVDKVVGTISGPAGKLIATVAFAVSGLILIFGRNEVSEGVKVLLQVVFAISFIAFAATIVNTVFGSGFSGAVI